jgi:hypothetical protein
MGMCASNCSKCGRALESADGICLITYWWIKGEAVCKECAKKMPNRCSICGEYKGWCKHKGAINVL